MYTKFLTFGDFAGFLLKKFGDFADILLEKFRDFAYNLFMVFKRKIYNDLLRWKTESQGKTALLIQGARRIGKSTIVEEFAKNEYKTYILIDFSNTSKEIKSLFEDMSNLDNFFRLIQFYTNKSLETRKSVIIFDEVQLFPLARQAIKHLVKDGRYDYIETGSLISIKKNVKDILIPSEEKKINMYPMDFEEFSMAISQKTSVDILKEFFLNKKPMGDCACRKLMQDFRLFMIVGGMPQAVNELLESNNFEKIDEVKRGILELYNDDFMKIDSSGRISDLFNMIPAQLTKNVSRYNVSSVIENQRVSDIQEILAELVASMTVNIAYHVNDPNVGMSFTKDFRKFKLYLCDTGLFTTLAFKDKSFTENIIYKKLLSDKLHANLGYVFENVVAQLLKVQGHDLFYYTFPSETSNHLYEIDFLISEKNKISPIEVKSSGYKTHKSLDIFSEKFSSRIQNKYIFYTKDFKTEENITYVPIPMIQFM